MVLLALQSDCWCSRISIISLLIVCVCFIFYISYLLYIFVYVFLIIVVTLWASFSIINALLKQNQPLNYEQVEKNQWLAYTKQLLFKLCRSSELARYFIKPETEKGKQSKDKLSIEKMKRIENNQRRKKIKSFDPLLNTVDGRVKFMTQTVNQKFIAKWYTALISQDETFMDESKVLLEAIFKRLLLVVPFIDSDKFVIESFAVILRHLKEYRRAKKRAIKNNSTDVESVYRFALPSSRREETLMLHTHKITVHLMREFISWELWNSFPCYLLVAIFSKKITLQIVKHVSDPKWLFNNLYALLQPSSGQTPQEHVNGNETNAGSATKPTMDVESKKIPPKETKIVHREKPAEVYFADLDTLKMDAAPKSDVVDHPLTESDEKTLPLIVDCSDSLDWSHFSLNKVETTSEVTYKQIDPDVKVYQSTDVTSATSWNSEDFDFITMGQDLLAQTSEINLLGKRLWNFSGDSELETPAVGTKKSDTEAVIPTINCDETVNANGNKQLTAGALTSQSAVNIKELQTKSANAVQHTVSDAIHKIENLQDEAAGYVEGILDFGIAGLRKGLRLTGLQDNVGTTTTATLIPPASKIVKISPRIEEHLDGLTSSDSAEEVDIGDGLDDSPEYDEPSDLASSVAKLKSMLQQKTTSESGISTPAVSPMYGDEKYSTAIDGMSSSKNSTENFLARTVTGVFNTLRTALPGNVSDMVPQGTTLRPMSQRWVFIENDIHDTDLNILLESLLTERRDYCNIDTAYEAVDSGDNLIQSKNKTDATNSEPSYDDDFDDCFANIPMSHLLMDICCELLHDTKNSVAQDPVVRASLLVFGSWLETHISSFAKAVVSKSDSVDSILKNIAGTKETIIEENKIVSLLEEMIPGYIRSMIGSEDIHKALVFFIESLQIQSINIDLSLQFLEILSSSVIRSNHEISPKSPFE